jgi:hypothetical protein
MRDHSSSNCLRNQPDSLQIGIDDLVPVCFVLLQGWSRCRHAGVVDDNFNRTEARFSGVQRGLDARCDGDVHHDALSLAFGIADIIDGFGQRFRTARTDGYARSRAARKTAKKRPRPLEPPVTSTCDPSIVNGSFIANLSQVGDVASGHLVPDEN